MKRRTTVRFPKIIFVLVFLLFFLIVVKLSIVSLSEKVDDINLRDFANNRNTKTDVIYAKRGNIFDKDGNVLASTVNSYKLIAYLSEKRTTNPKKPQHVVDKEKTAKALAEVLKDKGMTYEYALERLNKEGLYQVEFGKYGSDISESLKNKIKELKLPGIDFTSGIKRTYSMGSFASYIVGYAKIDDNGEINGELGIEKHYNKDLSGTNGKSTYQTDAYGYTLPYAEVISEKEIDGNDIYLTIDSNIQLFAEDVTRNLANNYKLNWMIFAVMDAKTGAILASSTSPNFDPNKLNTIKNYINPLVSYEYEPGSTMKIFSFATAIEEGKYDGKSTYKSGSILVDDAVIRDFNEGRGWGTITYDTGFAYSSNVAATNLALKIGKTKLSEYYRNLGFGKKTGIELAQEVSGRFNIQARTELATASFGQGITVTPVQILQGLSAISNDGTVIKPYIVDKILDNDGNVVYEGKREEVGKVYSKETIDYMKELMYDVVYDGLDSSKIYGQAKTTLIGKTGTAQIASPKGGYLDGPNDYIRSFAGIFPKEDPKYIMYIAVQQLGSTSARPIATEVVKAVNKIVAYSGLEEKNKEKINKTILLNNYISKDTKEATDELKKYYIKPVVIGDGKYIVNQYPLKNSKVLEYSKVFLITNSSEYKMIDLKNWSLNEVQAYANLLNIKLNVNGSGYVDSQNIEPGTAINKETVLEVSLKK